MIIKNEAKQLKDCLDSVADICDEIILLDSGSTDDTKKIAKSYPHPNLQWHENHHWQGFGKQRQLAQNYATSDYILVLDADERLDGRLREAIVAVLNEPVRTDVVYSLARVNYFSGVATHLRGWYRDWEHRLYARKTFGYNDLEVHESVDYQDAKLVKLAGLQAHYTNDNLFHYLKKRLQYSHDWALDATKRGKNISLFGACMRALFSFLREYLLRGQLLAGAYGFVASVAIAFYTFNKYLLLWQNKQESR